MRYPTSTPLSRTSATLAIAALLGSAGAALAQNVYRLGIPDFDQRRAGLLADGSVHCVPTSMINLFAYAGNHGVLFSTNPYFGNRNWQLPANYAPATDLISDLGVMMSTSTPGGTNSTGGQNGLTQYIFERTLNSFTRTRIGISPSGLGPSPFTMSLAMLNGGLVAVCYGRYTQDGNGRWSRDGGHCMTLSAVQNGNTIYVRDPAADEGDVFGRLNNQSPFRTEKFTLAPVTAQFNTSEGVKTRTVYHLTERGPGRFFDSMYILWPQVAMTHVTIGNIPTVVYVTPNSLANFPIPTEQPVVPAGVQSITDVALGVDQAHGFFTGNTSRTEGWLFHHDRTSNAVRQLIPLGSPGKLVVDRFGKIWCGDGSVLKIVTDNGLLLPAVQTVVLPEGCQPNGIFYDDVLDEMHVLSTANDRLVIAIADGSVRANLRLPPGIDLQGDGSVCPAPTPGQIFLGHMGDGSVRIVRPSGAAPVLELLGTFTLPGVTSIRSMQLDDRGHLFIGNGTDMHEFMQEAASGRWVAVPNSPWSGRLSRGKVDVARSRSSFVPGLEPGDFIIPNGETGSGGSVLDCVIDFNLDGNNDPDDLSDYIAGYFSIIPGDRFFDSRLDMNQDGRVDPDDLSDYIAVYFGGEC